MDHHKRRAFYLLVALLAFACAMYAVLLYIASWAAARTYLVPLGLESPFAMSSWGAKVGQHTFTSSAWFFVGLVSWICGSWIVFFMRPKSDVASRLLPVSRVIAICAMIAVSFFSGSLAGERQLERAISRVKNGGDVTYRTTHGILRGEPVAFQNDAIWVLTKTGTQRLPLDEMLSADVRPISGGRGH